MKKIRLINKWYGPSEAMCMANKCTLKADFIWKDLLIVDKNQDYDAVFHNVCNNLQNFSFEKAILFQSEAKPNRKTEDYEFQELNKDKFLKYYDMEKYHSQDFHWNINMNYMQLNSINLTKSKIMSGLVSSLRNTELQNLRVDFLYKLDKLNFYDHYGYGGEVMKLKSYKGSPEYNSFDKGVSYIPYKYNFNSENVEYRGYFTEKIILPILFECLVFYSGCPNIQDFIDPRCYIKLDLKNPDECIGIIEESIKNNEWEKRIDIIRKEKKRIMNDLNPMEIIRKIINSD